MKPHELHRSQAPAHLSVEVVTVSSSRHAKAGMGRNVSDEGGDAAATEILKAGHLVVRRDLVSDSKPMIGRKVRNFLSGNSDVLVLTGGTGVARRDVTIETVRPFMEKELDGFGELLRRISYDEIGTPAILTRATAGVARGKVILCLPGSPGAVKTALRSFMQEIPHVVYVSRL